MVVDHINGDGLDNRRENLREATQAQNLQNLRLRSDNTSQYKGVSRVNSHTWEATVNERVIGYFDTALDASFAYDKAALDLYGEFAYLNNSLEQVREWTQPARQFGRKSASGYRGVFACENRWGAEIKDKKQRCSLGFFETSCAGWRTTPDEVKDDLKRPQKILLRKRLLLTTRLLLSYTVNRLA
jgi:hypothetical protein